MPFGTALESESTGSISRRFTSYDRSASTGLDYATNRFYDSSQGRFTTVDPIKMSATSILNPQTLNLYGYTANDPVNRTDPSGLDWGFPTIGGSGAPNQFPSHPGGWYGVTGGTGYSIPSGLSQFLTGFLGNLFGGGRSYAGTIGIPTFTVPLRLNLNTGSMTPSAPPPLPGAGTTREAGNNFSPPPDNPSCITNAIAGSRLTTNSNEMIRGRLFYMGNTLNEDPLSNDHDGIHILDPTGGTYNVRALSAMTGRVLHYGFQNSSRQASNLDIQLNISLKGVPLVLTIKDMIYAAGAFKSGSKITQGQSLGTATGGFYANGKVDEASGIHVTLMTLSTYRNYVAKGGKSPAARRTVPVSRLIDAYNDSRSPFKCP